MKIGIVVGRQGETLDQAIDNIVQAEQAGFASVWRPHIFGLDALTVLALAGSKTERIELGTAVVPTYPRHPHSLAQQAATADLATGGRLALGVGRSHQVVIENMFGLVYDKPITHMREYVTAMRDLFAHGFCSIDGKNYRINAPLELTEHRPIPILVGALMPKMLELCGQLCDGTLTWMAGPKYVADTIVPALESASSAAGRPTPRTVVSLPLCVTDDADGARQAAAKMFEVYGTLPVYRACLDAEGAAGPADVALVGNEDEVRAGLQRLVDAGATDFYAGPFPHGDEAESMGRSMAFLQSLGGALG